MSRYVIGSFDKSRGFHWSCFLATYSTKILEEKKDNRRRFNECVFCNMTLSEELTITFTNMTRVSYVGRHPQR